MVAKAILVYFGHTEKASGSKKIVSPLALSGDFDKKEGR